MARAIVSSAGGYNSAGSMTFTSHGEARFPWAIVAWRFARSVNGFLRASADPLFEPRANIYLMSGRRRRAAEQH
jgi:hypothetical protein